GMIRRACTGCVGSRIFHSQDATDRCGRRCGNRRRRSGPWCWNENETNFSGPTCSPAAVGRIYLHKLKYQSLFEAEERFAVNMTSVSGDGSVVCTGLYEDLSKKFKVNLLHGYVGFHEYHDAKPLSQIVAVNTDGTGSEVLHEERYWIGHVNA